MEAIKTIQIILFNINNNIKSIMLSLFDIENKILQVNEKLILLEKSTKNVDLQINNDISLKIEALDWKDSHSQDNVFNTWDNITINNLNTLELYGLPSKLYRSSNNLNMIK